MIGTLISVSSLSWFRIWIGLEINLLSFIPLIRNKKNIFSSESTIKYFLIQSIASVSFLFFILFYYFFLNLNINQNLNISNILISSIILLKIGAAPFHFWFPRVSEGLTWINNLVLITWQKIAPIIIISYTINLNYFIIIIICCLFIGRLGGLNQTSLRKLIAYSSINHIGWILRSLILRENIWVLYFIFYLFLLINIIYYLNFFKIFFLNQTFIINYSNKFIKILFSCLLLSLGGLPPFLGFFPKWIIIELLILNNYFILLFFLIFFTLLTLYFYLRITYNAFLFNNKQINWNFKFNINKKNFIYFFNSSLILNFSLILINLFFI
jgi:NADH-ubiquinone oxidoreductase chain 2